MVICNLYPPQLSSSTLNHVMFEYHVMLCLCVLRFVYVMFVMLCYVSVFCVCGMFYPKPCYVCVRSDDKTIFCRFPDQVSHTIFLEKGKSYYLEEIGRQSTGRENLSLGVELPDGKRFFPIPNKFLSKYNKKSSRKGKYFTSVTYLS